MLLFSENVVWMRFLTPPPAHAPASLLAGFRPHCASRAFSLWSPVPPCPEVGLLPVGWEGDTRVMSVVD